jgi:hypothetical protein
MGRACSLFVGKPEGKRQLGSLRRRWADSNGSVKVTGSFVYLLVDHT